MRIEIVDNDRQRAERILLLLSRAPEVDEAEGWQYVELAGDGWIYGGWVRLSADGTAEGHTISVKDARH
ncbi:MAG TPA: hypothetical protein VIZ63_25025 [Povalibacter sp.]